MQQILRKRVRRDLKENRFRYAALGLLIVVCMYIVCSIIGAGETIVQETAEHARENKVEDGQFTCFVPLSKADKKLLADKGIALEAMFYLDFQEEEAVIRVFGDRKNIDLVELLSGTKAEKENEAVLEKRYAKEHGITVGDTIQIGGLAFVVSGIGTTPDYEAPKKEVSDMSVKSDVFGTAFVTDTAYAKLKKTKKAQKTEEYLYAYRLGGQMESEDLKKILKDFVIEEEEISDPYFQEYWERTGGTVTELEKGVRDLKKGAKELADGLCRLNRQKKVMNRVPEKLLEQALQTTEKTLEESGVHVVLTEENYQKEMNRLIEGQSGMTALLLRSAKKDLDSLKQYKDGVAAYTKGVEKAKKGADSVADGMAELQEGTEEFLGEAECEIANLKMFLTAEDNTRIGAAANDKQIDISTGFLIGIILMILFAYVLSIFVIHTIEKESPVIGTLYALGVTRRDLLAHYLTLPVMVTTVSAVIGFIIVLSGAGIPLQMKSAIGYFSLPELSVRIPPYLIVYGLVMPPLAAVAVNYVVIRKRLSQTALSLIRNEKKKKKLRKVTLRNMKFLRMFQLRQMLREARAGITVAVGMFISLLCMMIALDCYELCTHLQEDSISDTKYRYMYTLKYPTEEVPEGGSPALAKTLKKERYGYNWDITVLGIEDDNPYFDAHVEEGKGKMTASSALAQKYGLSVGDEFTMRDEEENRLYVFEVTDICEYSPAFYAFMDIDSARELFGEQEDYYNTLFSEKELNIPAGRLYASQTKEDVEESGSVFVEQMWGMISTVIVASVFVFVLVMYLMMKTMIDRSSYHISLMKVLGFHDKEIRKLYLDGNFYIVLFSAFLCIPLSKAVIDWAYPRYLVNNVASGMDLSFEPWLYTAVLLLILLCYFVINHILVGRLRKVTPAEVLKNRE